MLPPSIVFLAAVLASPTAPADGEALIREMYDRYAGRWYRTATFIQTTTFVPENRREIWYEAMQVPGMLRIDIAPLDSANAILFRNDSLFRFARGQLVSSRPFVHPLMVLGFDVYASAPATTVRRLRTLGFDLSKIREDTWQGRPAYVVGAEPGDVRSPQFWIDRENLYFVRLLEPSRRDSMKVSETLFNRYQRAGGGWMAVEVIFRTDGKTEVTEQYADVRVEVDLDDVLFDSAAWHPAVWAGEAR